MILIGSKALQHYIPDLGRVVHDWDLLMYYDEYERFHNKYSQYLIKSVKSRHIYEIPEIGVVEIFDEFGWSDTDRTLEFWQMNSVFTQFGVVQIPLIYILHSIKKATVDHIDEPKHKHDLELIQKTFGENNYNHAFYIDRSKEIEERLKTQKKVKYDFFHKYEIPEYIEHDYLHKMIADLLGISIPTYKRITSSETDISQELFNNLTHNQKVSLLAEETLVLNLERWLIPQLIEQGINYKVVGYFYNNNEGLPTYKILKHVCITGLKGEANYITDFARANFFEIEKLWQDYKIKIKENGGFPRPFYDRIFKLRDQFKSGEKVSII